MARPLASTAGSSTDDGLLHDGLPGVHLFQQPYVRRRADLAGWETDSDDHIGLVEVVREVRPHALIGVTGQPGLFTEDVVRAMADGVDRPVVLPLSNPTPRCEAIPADVIAWTGGRALVGTGSPFPPVEFGGTTHSIAQVNNIYVFPGIGLGVLACRASAVTIGMVTAASLALADEASRDRGEVPTLLPAVEESRAVARAVASAVALQAMRDGVAHPLDAGELERRIDEVRWYPEYGRT